MAEVTPVNGQITDAVTQGSVSVIGGAPAQAVAVACQSLAHSMSIAMTNAQQAQAGLQQIGNAGTASSIALILSVAGQIGVRP